MPALRRPVPADLATRIGRTPPIRPARELGPGHVIVTMPCDSGARHPRKLFNPALLREKGIAVPEWLDRAFPEHRAGRPRRRRGAHERLH